MPAFLRINGAGRPGKNMIRFRLKQELQNYASTDMLPMHMPGHKRNEAVLSLDHAARLDITEIEGFDDLHHPEGILKESMENAAAVYGSDDSFYLVGGSTAGILAGIAACVRPGGRILMARNAHVSVYNAVILNALRPAYLLPGIHPAYGIAGSIDPADVREALRKAADGTEGQFSLVVITSPTYEGVLSDVQSISGICHEYNVPLLVDAAHGAHLLTTAEVRQRQERECRSAKRGTGCVFPAGALACGADIVIESLHKTMPAPTQTGILHCRKGAVDPAAVKRYLDIYQTSSPSYLLMAGIENALAYRLSKDWYCGWETALASFYERTADMKTMRVIPPGKNDPFFDRDPSKLVVCALSGRHTGAGLMRILRTDYAVEAEMAAGTYIIAMTGAGDKAESIARFARALLDIDRRWGGEAPRIIEKPEKLSEKTETERAEEACGEEEAIGEYEYAMTPSDAFQSGTECILPKEAAGRIAHDCVTIYPPGIPLMIPGEIITESVIKRMRQALDGGLKVTGLEGDRVRVVKKE